MCHRGGVCPRMLEHGLGLSLARVSKFWWQVAVADCILQALFAAHNIVNEPYALTEGSRSRSSKKNLLFFLDLPFVSWI